MDREIIVEAVIDTPAELFVMRGAGCGSDNGPEFAAGAIPGWLTLWPFEAR